MCLNGISTGSPAVAPPYLVGRRSRSESAIFSIHSSPPVLAWGQLSDTSTSAVNLGIFYVHDPAQKRWTLRFDNPAVLNKLSAVFVTVEPHGGAAKPSGQKLMYAYLGREPNHP
jgi:hypothetical protein